MVEIAAETSAATRLPTFNRIRLDKLGTIGEKVLRYSFPRHPGRHS